MAYRYGDRKQKILFPQSVDEYIPEDAPVRAYDVFVDSLDFDQLGIEINSNKVGCPQYDPRSMLKLLIYGYSYGIRSSRKLERETHYNLSFIWLTGSLKPDHKTIAQFRRNNRSALHKVLKQCAQLCIKLDLIEGNTLFVDGTKIRANASIKHTWTKEDCKKRLKKIDRRIREILSECDNVDDKEKNLPSLVKMTDELKDQKLLKNKVKKILKELESENKKSINTTDPDCSKMHSIQGIHAGYNVQSVVDEKHGLIVSSDVVNENNDVHQFAEQIEKAHENLGKKCETACGDAGYAFVDELEKIDQQDINVIVPSAKQVCKKDNTNPFDKSKFKYDRENNCYICPAGKILTYRRTETKARKHIYRIKRSICEQCCHFGVCTTGKIGRKLIRLVKEDLREKLETQYEQPQSQRIYNLRKQKVELPFGHIKHNLSVTGFLLRGLDGVKAEASILSSCFNIARMISIMSVSGIITKLSS